MYDGISPSFIYENATNRYIRAVNVKNVRHLLPTSCAAIYTIHGMYRHGTSWLYLVQTSPNLFFSNPSSRRPRRKNDTMQNHVQATHARTSHLAGVDMISHSQIKLLGDKYTANAPSKVSIVAV